MNEINMLLKNKMAELSPNAFKLLFLIANNTDDNGDDAVLSYSIIREATGISSDTTIGNAIKELLELKYIARTEVENLQGFNSHNYSLNIESIAFPIVDNIHKTCLQIHDYMYLAQWIGYIKGKNGGDYANCANIQVKPYRSNGSSKLQIRFMGNDFPSNIYLRQRQEGFPVAYKNYRDIVKFLENCGYKIEYLGTIARCVICGNLDYMQYENKLCDRCKSKQKREDVLVNKKEYVYVLKSIGLPAQFYKIGRTKDVEVRTKTLGVLLPFEIEPLLEIKTNDSAMLEKHLHEKFSNKRAGGEWFQLNESDLREIENMGNKIYYR